mmetsp:Transcript_701/g.1826  ORF Transcript_701/g.1826 Transcript_701/m.1826 type:complete len:97 (-) Transcript_701:260-550(-)|eukprot:4797-Prymnesium_polylepis.1
MACVCNYELSSYMFQSGLGGQQRNPSQPPHARLLPRAKRHYHSHQRGGVLLGRGPPARRIQEDLAREVLLGLAHTARLGLGVLVRPTLDSPKMERW